jgi:hypothetical protein
VLFSISLESRRVEFVACTPHPTGTWVAQQARNLLLTLDDREQQFSTIVTRSSAAAAITSSKAKVSR